ncbi:MAG: hypothetical protein QNJ06_00300 [Kiloniellales bacterium]|nr:hypothetical protein [Kiloniellales bacterium]
MDQGRSETTQRLFESGIPTIEALARRNLPLEFGAVVLDAEGRVTPRDPEKPLHFRFHYLGVPFDVEISGAESAEIRLLCDLGELPYTAESPVGRHYAQQLVRSAAVLPHGRIFIDSRQHIRLEAACPRPNPSTLSQVFAVIAAMLLESLPYLRFLTDVLPQRSYRTRVQ